MPCKVVEPRDLDSDVDCDLSKLCESEAAWLLEVPPEVDLVGLKALDVSWF